MKTERICKVILLAAILILAMFMAGCSGAESVASAQTLSWQEQYDLGMRYLSEGRYEEAILAFTEAIAIDPRQPAVYLARAQAYEQLGESEENYEAARQDYEKAQELGSTEEEIWLGYSNESLRQGDFMAALDILYQGLEEVGESSAIQQRIDSMFNSMGGFSYPGGALYTGSITGQQGDVCIVKRIYDAQEKLLSITILTEAQDILGTMPVERDENGNHTSGIWIERQQDGTYSLMRIEREFDADNRLLQEAVFNPAGEKQNSTRYTYDESGMCIRIEEYDGQDTLQLYADFVEYIDHTDPRATGTADKIYLDAHSVSEPEATLEIIMSVSMERNGMLSSFDLRGKDYNVNQKYGKNRSYSYEQDGDQMVYIGYTEFGVSIPFGTRPEIFLYA